MLQNHSFNMNHSTRGSFLLFIVSVQLYSPRRPAVDVAEVFLWLMAIGTILCASYWSAWSAREAAIEHDKLLKVCTYFGNTSVRLGTLS